jgi:diphthamide biosynthesis protein 4
MGYTKNYYDVLGLATPSWSSTKQISAPDLRKAYKIALLAAHPDKQRAAPAPAAKAKAAAYSVDDVKEAYTILADKKSRADYDNYLLRNPGLFDVAQGKEQQAPSSDFILGLELLDLSDFDVHEPVSSTSGSSADEEQMEWTRGCRCGAEKGFGILEEELEDAEKRGEKEVLVGCEGCSLWVRVGFEVEEG